ncbi:MAG: sensor histidine kinase [Myxococcaceae bacterium]
MSARTRALFAIALGAVFVVSFASVALFRARAGSTARVHHALLVVVELDAFLSALRDAETGQRGFLLTGRESYLTPYRAGAQEAPARLDSLRRILEGDPANKPRLTTLERVTRAKLDELDATVQTAQAGRRDEALSVVYSDRGKTLMDEIRTVVAEMTAAQQHALVTSQQEQERAGMLLVGTALGGGVILAVLTVLAFLGARRDVRNAERVAVERARTHDYQQRAISILSHDIRGPLMAAQLSSERLTRGLELPADSVARRSADVVQRSTQRALRIVNSLLDLTHLRLGDGLPLSPEPGDVLVVARAVVDEANAEDRGRVELETLGTGAGVFDEVRIGQALSNLIANGLKYGRPGSPVRVRVDARDEDRLTLLVQNDGDPIPADLLPRLFDPFQRGESRVGARESLGLGLYIVREIARAHGGHVEVRSSGADGTRFTLEFPRRVPEAEARPAEGTEGTVVAEPATEQPGIAPRRSRLLETLCPALALPGSPTVDPI